MTKITEQTKQWSGVFEKDYTDRNIFSTNDLDRYYKETYGIEKIELNKEILGKIMM